MRTFPEAVSAQQHVFTSSLCPVIFTVLRSAMRSYTGSLVNIYYAEQRLQNLPKIILLPPAMTSLPSAENLQLQMLNESSHSSHSTRPLDRGAESLKDMGVCSVEASNVEHICMVLDYRFHELMLHHRVVDLHLLWMRRSS